MNRTQRLAPAIFLCLLFLALPWLQGQSLAAEDTGDLTSVLDRQEAPTQTQPVDLKASEGRQVEASWPVSDAGDCAANCDAELYDCFVTCGFNCTCAAWWRLCVLSCP